MVRNFSNLDAAAVLVLVAFAALGGCSENGNQSGSPPDSAPEQVGVITLHQQDVPFVDTVPGRTVAPAVAEIRPQVNGIIQRRLFQEGSEVKSGDVLYQIDDRQYRAALDSAKASVERAEATVANAQAAFERNQELRGRNVVSDQQVDAARAALEEAQADVSLANANVQTAQINLDNTRVTAPISGLIGTSAVTEGALVTANQTTALTTVRQLDPMLVDLTTSSANLLRARRMLAESPQQSHPPEVRLTLEDGSEYDQVGTVQAAESNVSETTGTITVRGRIANPQHLLLPGMYVRATVAVGTATKGFLLPQRAVSRNAKGQATAMFVSGDGKAELRTLQTDQSYRNAWLVRAGVNEGDRLIVDGLQKVRPGEPVQPVEVRIDDKGLVEAGPATAASQ